SRTEVRPLRGGVRSRGKARTQAASLNSEKRIVVDSRISPGNRTQSRQYAVSGRQQSCSRQGKRAGHHRGLRAGHVNKRVIRELGRASRLLGSNCRSKGDVLATSVPRKGRRDIEPANCLNETGMDCDKVQAHGLRMDGQQQSCALWSRQLQGCWSSRANTDEPYE